MKTKNLMKLGFVLFAMTFMSHSAKAQLLKKVTDRVVNTAENKVINKAGSTTSKGMDEIEDGVTGKNKKKKKEKPAPKKAAETPISYSNYDFEAGNKPIFYYDMSGEKDAEIPEKMLLDAGNAAVQTYKGSKVLSIPANEKVVMAPFMKNKNYLPNNFTIEFDVLTNTGVNTDLSQINIYLLGKNESSGNQNAPIVIKLQGISGAENTAKYEFLAFSKDSKKSVGTTQRNLPSEAVNAAQNNWRRVAISVDESIGKLYVDKHRIGVLNQITPNEANRIEFEIITDKSPVLLKNFKISTQ